MKIIFSVLGRSEYYVGMNEIPYDDKDIAEKIRISFNEYVEILTKFNAYIEYDTLYYFTELEDCQRCCDYLNDTYGLIMALEE